MFKFIDRNLLAILIYISVYFIINIVFLYSAKYFSEIIKDSLQFMGFIPAIYRFWIFFILQEILLLWILYLSFYFKFSYWKWLLLNIKEYFSSQFLWRWFKELFVYSFWFLFLYLLVNALINILLTKYQIKIPWFFGEQEVMTFLQGIKLDSFWSILIMFLSVVIIWPMVEELIYRWFITNLLLNKFWPWPWMILSAFIFDIVHMEWAVFWNIFILSFMLSYIFYKTRSIRYTFGFHAAVNWLAFVAMVATQFVKM